MDSVAEPAAATPQAAVDHLAELLSLRAGRSPTAAALVDRTGSAPRRWDWRELDAQVGAVAAGLAATGLRGGQRVALSAGNSAAFVLAYLAVLRAGLVAVPLDPGLPEQDQAELIEETGVRLLLSDRDRSVAVPVRPLTLAGLAELTDQGHLPVITPPDPEALAVLLPTAGTSGEPKIVMLTHRALVAHACALAGYRTGDDPVTVLAAAPFAHVFGLSTVLGGWLAGGSRLVVVDGFADTLLDVVAQEQVTELPLTPAAVWRLLQESDLTRMAGVRTVLSAAAPLPWTLGLDLHARTGLQIEQGYGLTEAGGGVATTIGHRVLGPAHVGRALTGIGIRIGTGAEPGEPGSIWVRGASLFSGYWPDGLGGPDADGWFDTGDIGYLSGTDLFLVDRARELMVVNGFTVYPSEVEQAVGELDGVRSVAVVGLPDQRTGQRIVVAVVAPSLTETDVADFCRRRLAVFKRPATVVLVEDLPRGVTGKVRRAELRRQLEAAG